MDATIIGIALFILLVAPAVWWAASALRKRNRRREAAEAIPAPDPLAALSAGLTTGLEGVREQMRESLDKVQGLMKDLAEQGGKTGERLSEVAKSNDALTAATGQLQNLLDDSRNRGLWGSGWRRT